MTEAARPQLAVPEFFDRVPRVRGWVISADESDSARTLLATLLRGLFSDRMNLEGESHGYPQWGIEGWELVHDDESIEARLWRRFSPTGPEADLPAPHDFSGALYDLLDRGLGNGPFDELRQAALMVVDDCLAYNAAYLAKHGETGRPVTGQQVAANTVWWRLHEQGIV